MLLDELTHVITLIRQKSKLLFLNKISLFLQIQKIKKHISTKKEKFKKKVEFLKTKGLSFKVNFNFSIFYFLIKSSKINKH